MSSPLRSHMHSSAYAPPKSLTVSGIAILIVGLSFAAYNGALMKLLTPTLPAILIVWGRYMAYLLVMMPIALARHGKAVFAPPRPGLQVVRALLLVAATLCFVLAASKMPFADAIAIIYVYPFVLTALSPLLLGEHVPPAAWMAVTGGFAGVLIVMRPEFGHIDAHALLALGAGIFLGLHLIVTRKLARAASAVITSTYTALVSVLALTPMAPFVWQTLDSHVLGIMATMGFVSALGQWLIIVAYSRAPAPMLAPFSYVEIISAIFIGFLLFGDLPDRITWLGIAVIIVSGVIVARTAARAVASRRTPAV